MVALPAGWPRAAESDVESLRANSESETQMSERVEPITNERRRRLPRMAVLIGVMLLSVGFILFQFRSGIRVTVHDTGATSGRWLVLLLVVVGDLPPITESRC